MREVKKDIMDFMSKQSNVLGEMADAIENRVSDMESIIEETTDKITEMEILANDLRVVSDAILVKLPEVETMPMQYGLPPSLHLYAKVVEAGQEYADKMVIITYAYSFSYQEEHQLLPYKVKESIHAMSYLFYGNVFENLSPHYGTYPHFFRYDHCKTFHLSLNRAQKFWCAPVYNRYFTARHLDFHFDPRFFRYFIILLISLIYMLEKTILIVILHAVKIILF